MSALGPFEPMPRVAVGVSGGADSLALALLLNDWALARGGAALALTVDHGLRPEAAAEARQVARILAPHGIEHGILRWRAARPAGNLQAAARHARYGLLAAWCARRGVLHLALAHHLDDQAETVLLRLGRGSGLDGLAAMAPVRELDEVRLLRPLLAVPKARLRATARARGLAWIEDPGNRDRAQARPRLRALAPRLAREGLTAARLAATAGHLARTRTALEAALAELLARIARIHPAGFAWLDGAALVAAPDELGLRALARLVTVVGGGDYAPRFARVQRLHARIGRGLGRGATLGGCRILTRRDGLLIVREPAAAEAVPVVPGQRLLWDGRFRVALARAARSHPAGAGDGWTLGPLGEPGWSRIKPEVSAAIWNAIPPAARAVLPALKDRDGIAEIPHLGFSRGPEHAGVLRNCLFAPKNALSPTGFTVA